MRVLYIGGTGEISFSCIQESVRAGHNVCVYNRGNHNAGLPASVQHIKGDVNDDAAYATLAAMKFDAICQFRVFTPEQLQRDIELFAGKAAQYVFISSESAYKRPLQHWVITEDVPLGNPFNAYSRGKAECEMALRGQSRLPYTIVRPGHTLRFRIVSPFQLGALTARRMLAGRPLVVPGDGNNLWTITYCEDFAPPFVRLLGNEAALNDHFHLTSDNAYSWNEIHRATAKALGAPPLEMVHVPSETLIRYHPPWEEWLFGDNGYSVTFDNSKVKSVVGDFDCPTTLDELMARTVGEFLGRGGLDEDVDLKFEALFDRIVADQSGLGR